MLDLMPDRSPAGTPRRVTDLGFAWWPAWSPDGSRILFATDRDGVGIWQIDRRGNRPRPVSGAPITAEAPTLAKRPGGHTSLIFTNSVSENSIWRYSTGPGPAEPAVELAPSTWSQSHARYSNDRRRLAFSSTRSGYQEVWPANADGSQPVQLTNLKHRLTEAGQWSPTDETVAFVSQERERRQIYMAPASGGPAVPVTNEEGVRVGTGWSHDGRRYYYDSSRSGRREVWRVSPAGGASEQMTANGGVYGFESGEGVFYYWLQVPGKGAVLMRRETAGDREVVLDPPGRYLCATTPSPGGFYYLAAGAAGIYRFEEAASPSVPVLKHPVRPFTHFTITADGKWLTTSFTGKLTRDLMIMEHFR